VRQRKPSNTRHSMTSRRCRIVSLARRTRDANMSLPEAQDLYGSTVFHDNGNFGGAADLTEESILTRVAAQPEGA
jgi:hypothetical protein